MNMMALVLCSLLYIILLSIIFFSKKRLSSMENTIFKVLMILNIWGLSIELSCYYTVMNIDKYPLLNTVITKGLLIYYFVWNLFFTAYVYAITYDKKKHGIDKFNRNMKLIKKIFIFLGIAFTFIILALPLYYVAEPSKMYSYGPAADLTNLTFVISMIIWTILLFINRKNYRNKKYIPIYFFILAGSIFGVIQKMNPHLTIMTSFETLVVFLMFFTIENPDLQMLHELNENKHLIEENYEANSALIFNLSQDVKKPIKDLKEVYEVLKTCELDEREERAVAELKNISDDLNFISSNLLDVSTLDAQNIKIMNGKYNIRNVVYTVSSKIKENLSNEVEYRYNIASNVPNTLYGDDVKLKQILMTILLNSKKHTKKGFIELGISSIVKYDACRLLITIEDSGIGMPINMVNDLMSQEGELTDKEVKLLDNLDLNIKLVSKIVKLIGGHLLIKSDVNKGTKITIILEQRIPEEKQTINYLKTSKRVLVVSENKNVFQKIKDKLDESDIKSVNSIYGKDAIDKIKNKEDYDLVIVDDDLSTLSELEILKQIKDINKDITIIILLSKEKQDFIDDYLNDGFGDYILKNKLKTETERIRNKYLQ